MHAFGLVFEKVSVCSFSSPLLLKPETMHFPHLSLSPRFRTSFFSLICLLLPAFQAYAYDGTTLAAIEQVAQTAESYLGTPHRLGGTSRSGIDCSGLMYVSFLKVNQTLPRVSRDQAKVGQAVQKQALRRGDLIFFAQNGRVFHVGLVLENTGRDVLFVHASGSRGVIRSRLSESYWRQHYSGARRTWPQATGTNESLATTNKPVAHISILDTTASTVALPGRFPQASQRLLTRKDLRPLNQKQLRLVRNEIFARHGYVFQSADLRKYFGKQKWYRKTPKIRDQQALMLRLSAIEKTNITLIRQLEK